MVNNLFHVIFWSAIVTVRSSDIFYSTESFTYDGNPCMTDCVNNLCIKGWSAKKFGCNPGDKPGLEYFTAQVKTQKKICKSKCGKFDGYEKDWCYVSDSEWDYCDSVKATTVRRDVVLPEAMFSGFCWDDCDYHGETYTWCKTLWSTWDKCVPEKISFEIARTIEGRQCVGICGKHGKTYNWCYNYDHAWDYCSPPAQDFSIMSKLHDDIPKLRSEGTCKAQNRKKRAFSFVDITNFAANGVVRGYAKLFERPDNGFETVDLNEEGNAVTRYTVLPPGVEENPTLPVVVRATVDPSTVRASNSRTSSSIPSRVTENLRRMGMNVDIIDNNQDERGHIIAYINGGPGEVYNFAPMTHNLNRGAGSLWSEQELRIRDFVRSTGGSARIIIVLIYHDLARTTRPEGLAVNVELFNPDGSLHDECIDQYYSNDT